MDRNEGYSTFPASVRKQILERDGYQCQVCGRLGPERGGSIDLEAHHMQENPEFVDRDHPDNGTTMCIPCHHLVTHRLTADDLPFDLDGVAAEVNLLYKDIEILTYLYEHGPATTSEIREVTSGSSRTSIIERLWTLMSVDRETNALDEPLIDKDLDTEEWGYPDDIGRTVRGRIPNGEEELMNRLRDELLRQLLDAGVSRSTVGLFFGRSRRATFYISKRAGALRVPFDDESHPDALMQPEEFDVVVDQLADLFEEVAE